MTKKNLPVSQMYNRDNKYTNWSNTQIQKMQRKRKKKTKSKKKWGKRTMLDLDRNKRRQSKKSKIRNLQEPGGDQTLDGSWQGFWASSWRKRGLQSSVSAARQRAGAVAADQSRRLSGCTRRWKRRQRRLRPSPESEPCGSGPCSSPSLRSDLFSLPSRDVNTCDRKRERGGRGKKKDLRIFYTSLPGSLTNKNKNC